MSRRIALGGMLAALAVVITIDCVAEQNNN